MSDKDEEVQYNVKLRRQLREDAKRNTKRGELAEDVRDLFRRKAYGFSADSENTELERTRAELEKVRERIDDLRRERRRIDAEIESQESRATRLEEKVSRLEERDDRFSTVVETLESLLLDGARIFPERVDDDLDAEAVITELKERNPDVPAKAFELSTPNEPTDWRDATDIDWV